MAGSTYRLYLVIINSANDLVEYHDSTNMTSLLRWDVQNSIVSLWLMKPRGVKNEFALVVLIAVLGALVY